MTTRLLIATHNRNKLSEYRELFAGLAFELLTLNDVGIHDDVEEDGATFAENARIKAMEYSRKTGLWTLADDSGLEVDALGGEPGVRSKRYAGDDASEADRNVYLLGKLRETPRGKRSARFRCAIAIASPRGEVWEADGTCEGEISFAPCGTNGFGYDPLFYFPERGATLAELSPDEKNQVSHRARAAQAIKKMLKEKSLSMQ